MAQAKKSKDTLEPIPLTKLSSGQAAVIISYTGGSGFQRRLMDMGLKIGMEIKLLNNSRFKGPILLSCGESRLVLGYGMADKILVQIIENK